MSIVVLHEPMADHPVLPPGGAGGTTVHAAPTDVPLTRTFCGQQAEGMSQVDMEAAGAAAWGSAPESARVCPECNRAVTVGHWDVC
ncbi:hypothetical protein [Streptomyces sp. NRRL B-24484]|uniref:hypothetical protein n=1 Tax=Streptomyces sp. NRRL B-24484 TaxID=1463833 RepID=UPI0004C00F8E|nr:hypothetical protein [Streptomyces sp. NRRL B-24484]